MLRHAHSTDALTVVAVVVVPVHVARIEVKVVGVVGVVSIQRARPIVAVRTRVVERASVAVARGGQADNSATAVI